MGGSDLLPCLDKRELLNDASESPESLSSWGERYQSEGFLSDAVDFYEKAGNGEALRQLSEQVKEEGDFFLFNRISRILKLQPGPEEWQTLVQNAEKLGKMAFAVQARLKERSSEGGQPH